MNLHIKRLAPFICFTMILIVLRMYLTQSFSYTFLVWNQFLAILPLYFSVKLATSKTQAGTFTWAVLWLLFFPNALYLVTDLIHLHPHTSPPMWLDLIILFSAALNGIIAGFISVHNVEKRLSSSFSKPFVRAIIFCIMLLAGFGVYLGRFQRWNSWDVIARPFSLTTDIARHVIHPFRYAEGWVLTGIFAVWMYLLYQYLKHYKLTSGSKD
ncbi:DUF1361 domain-containing protein [Chitinophagaceae bacterium MMS25-I14]